MSKNIGSTDKWVRVVVGVLLLGFIFMDGPWKWLGFIAVVPLVTAYLGVCPAWSLLGINTRKSG